MKSSYILQGGEEGAKRLRILAEATWPTTRTLLLRAGLGAGMRCLDVGCGSGEVTLELARLVGPRAEVIGVDADPSILEHARVAAEREGLLNVRFLLSDATELDALAGFDLVYSRFLLTHLRDPMAAVESMKRCLKPGGALVLEDIDFAGHFSDPPCPAFSRFVALYEALATRRGADPFIGPRLLGLLLRGGLTDVLEDVVLPTFRTGAGKLVALLTTLHIREATVEAGLGTAAELDELIEELERFTADQGTLLSLPRIFQVWGKRAGDRRR